MWNTPCSYVQIVRFTVGEPCMQGRDVYADVRYMPDGNRQTHTHSFTQVSLCYFGRWGRKWSDLASVHMCTSVSSGCLYIWGSIGSGACLVWWPTFSASGPDQFSFQQHWERDLDSDISIWTDFETWLKHSGIVSIISQQGRNHTKWRTHSSTVPRPETHYNADQQGAFHLRFKWMVQIFKVDLIWLGTLLVYPERTCVGWG